MTKKSPTPRPSARAAHAHATRAFEEVDDRITIPLATSSSAATPNATLVSGINKYRSLSRSATASSAPSTASSSVHATFKSGMVAAVRQHNQSQQSPSQSHTLASPQDRAQALVEKKQFAAALPLYTEALAATASAQAKLKLFFQRGVCALSAHKYKLAVEDLTYVIDLTPSNAMLLAKRAKAHAALQQFEQALLDYDAAIAMTPPSQAELRGLLMARAAVHAHRGSVGAAFDDLAVAQKDTLGGERDAELFYQRAQLRLQCRQHALAVDDLDRFLELQETSLDWPTPEDEPQEDERRQEELEDVRRRVEDVRMEHAALLMRLAREAEERRRADEKIAAVEQGEKQPLLGHVHSGGDYQTSSVPVKGKRRRSAAAMLKGADAAKSPERRLSEKRAARGMQDGLSYRDGDAIDYVERAARDYTQVLSSDPHHVDALRLRGDAMAKLDRVDDALHDYDAALAIDKHDFQVQVAKAKLLFAQRETRRAIAELTDVLQVNGFFVDALFLRAEMYEAQDEWEHAKSDYTSIIHATLDKKDAVAEAVTGDKAKKQSVAPAAKYTNEYATQALLLRARVAQRMHDYEAAARDYERILESSPNDVEAQYELQENNEKKEQYEKQRELDALAWLEEKEQEEEQRGGSGGGAGVNGAASGGKKKKKKSKKKKNAGGGGGAVTPTASVTTTGDDEERGAEENEATDDTDRREGHTKAESRIEDAREDAGGALTKKASSVSIVVTRDEACESMWEEQTVDELELLPLAAQLQRKRGASPRDLFPIRIDDDIEDDDKVQAAKREAEDEEETMQQTATDDDEEPDVEEPTPLEIPPIDTTLEDDASQLEKTVDASPVDNGDGGSGSPTSASTPSHVTIRERLVDERYLRKRQKQLDKLRSQLLEACEARDRDVLEETMARAERKLMADALEEEIAQARSVVVAIDEERRRAEEEKIKQERYRQQELERERRKKERELAAEKQKELQQKQQQQQKEEDSSKPSTPSLVIRPIAYGQALHVAEQHQQQLLQYQRLLQEKDAEIAYLKSLISSGVAVPETVGENGASALSVFTLLQRPSETFKAARKRMDALLEWMGPSAEADDVRFRILSFVRRVVERHWSQTSMAAPLLFIATGSFPMKTYLPTADLDVCLFLPKELEPTWHFAVLNALCMAGQGGAEDTAPALATGSPDAKLSMAPVGSVTPTSVAASSSTPSGPVPGSTSSSVSASAAATPLSTHTVRNVSFINAEVRVVKCTIDNVSVDVTANRVGALGALLLLDAMDQRAGRDHLLKRSVILIKSWCFHESSSYLGPVSASTPSQPTQSTLLGASQGALSTYAINTIVMSLFNSHGTSITHPLDALLLFLDKMATFPWHESALTLFGAVPLSLLATSGSLAAALHKLHKRQPHKLAESMALMTIDDVDALRRHVHEQFGALDPSFPPASGSGATGIKTFPMRACNVVDPLDDVNNLARSVSLESFPTMKRAFSSGRDRLTTLLSEQQATENTSNSVDAFFATCWRVYGRGDGWRPDLLIHPRQTWHARAPVAATTDEAKWQSLLPEFLLATAPLGTTFHHHPHQHQHHAPLHPIGLPLHPLVYHPPPPLHQRHQHHYYQHQHGHVPNGGSGGNSGQFHSSPGHYGGSRGGGGRYYEGGGGGVRSSASSSSSPLSSSPTTSHYKSPPRRTQSLPGSGSAVSLVAAAASSVYTNGHGETQSRGSHKGGHARRYDSPTGGTFASTSTSSSPGTVKTPPRNPKREL